MTINVYMCSRATANKLQSPSTFDDLTNFLEYFHYFLYPFNKFRHRGETCPNDDTGIRIHRTSGELGARVECERYGERKNREK